MGYVIKPRPGSARPWSLFMDSRVGGKARRKHIPEREMAAHGFLPSMTLEQAQEWRTKLNHDKERLRYQTRRQAIVERVNGEDAALNSHFPPQDLEAFERKLLATGAKHKKASHWRAAKVILTSLNLPVGDWEDEASAFYTKFVELEMSPSYVSKVLPILNAWGRFFSKRHSTPFIPLPAPKGYDRERIAEGHFNRHPEGLDSAPITPERLEAARSSLLPEQYNWMVISLWFGLRPHEVDRLHKPQGPSTWSIEVQEGVTVLCVYQTKLISVKRENRTKRIPVLYPEQEAALALILAQQFSRPLAKTLAKHLGDRVTCYAGRKSFEDLMESRGQQLAHYSSWLGHQTINTTRAKYTNKQKVRFTPILKKDA